MCTFKNSFLPGYKSFAAAKAAGADITLADNKWDAEMLKLIYAAKTEPAMVAIPPAMTQCNSDLVIVSMNGLIINGASVCPEIIDNSLDF